jgi:8-oxo-dGTP diphosphatase
MSAPTFTIRVYGLLFHEGRVLVSDELIRGRRITKFPGGGLEFGEGLKDCLVREIREEMGLEALDPQHFYTTDFFQQSSFHSTPMQVVSVYYSFGVAEPLAIPAAIAPFQGLRDDGQEVFRWLDLQHSVEEDLSLPIDRWVWRLLRSGPPACGPDLS